MQLRAREQVHERACAKNNRATGGGPGPGRLKGSGLRAEEQHAWAAAWECGEAFRRLSVVGAETQVPAGAFQMHACRGSVQVSYIGVQAHTQCQLAQQRWIHPPSSGGCSSEALISTTGTLETMRPWLQGNHEQVHLSVCYTGVSPRMGTEGTG